MTNNFEIKQYFDLSGFPFSSLFEKITYPWEVLPIIGTFITSYKKGKRIALGKGTVVEEGALIKGPAIIGKNCYIGHSAYLRENCILGDNVHIGHGCEIKNSVILSGTTIAHLNYIGDSVVGGNVNIAGGAMFANFRFDGKPIRIAADKKTIETGLMKFGSIVGDGSKIGVNAVLNPGTILGKDCVVYPLVFVTGVHKSHEKIK